MSPLLPRRDFLALSLSASGLLALRGLTAPAEEPEYEMAVIRNRMVRMRDGARLATDVYRPARNGVGSPRASR
jgi:hypothetical protein